MNKLILVILVVSATLFVQGQEVLNLSVNKIDSKSLSIGDTIKIQIKLGKSSFLLSSFQMYMKYDSKVLKYLKTNKVDNRFDDNWHDNDTGEVFAGLFIDMSRSGLEIIDTILLCELEYIYLGGNTELNFGTEEIRVEGYLKNGKTIFTGLDNNNLPLNFTNGCICPFE